MKMSDKPFLKMLRPYRGRVAVALVSNLFSVAALLGLVQVVRVMVDKTFNTAGTPAISLEGILLAFIALALVMAFTTYLRTVHFKMVGEHVVADLREKTFRHVLELDATFFEAHRSGHITSRLTADIAMLQHAIEASMPIAQRGIFQAIGGVALMVYTSPHLSGVILAVVALVMLLAVFFGRVVRRYGKQVQDIVADVNAQITETLQGVRVVQSLNQQAGEHARLKNTLNQQLALAEKYNRTRGGFFAFATFSLLAAMAAVFWFGGQAVLEGALSQGQLTAFLGYSLVAALGIGSLIEVFSAISNAAGAAERLVDLQKTVPDIKSPARPETLPKAKGGRALGFHDVTFTYPNKSQPTLKNVSFEAAPGDMIAIVGLSGAGKSTVFQLIPRFFDPQQGRITLDGKDITSLRLEDLRANVGIVAQDVFLFAGTVLENIRYGNPDATEQAVRQAARQAQADGFIQALPEGYQTQIGERGVKLSGGQRQRLAIARALLKAPTLLLLDEATSHLDAESEQEVQKALLEAQTGRTTIAIAHRLATVQAAKTILVLDKGQVVASGTHKELMAQSPLYKRLASLQFLDG